MIASFKLPDLVLGVRLAVNTRDVNLAAARLRAAVNSQFGRIAGTGAGLAGAGAAGLAGETAAINNIRGKASGAGTALSGAALASSLGTQSMVKEVEQVLPRRRRALKKVLSTIVGSYDENSTMTSLGLRGVHKAYGAGGALKSAAATAAAAGLTGRNMTVFTRAFTSFSRALGLPAFGRLLSLGKIGVILAAILGAVITFVKGIANASNYLKTNKAGGNLDVYASYLGPLSQALKQVSIQIGFFAIEVLNLHLVLPWLVSWLKIFGNALQLIQRVLAGIPTIGFGAMVKFFIMWNEMMNSIMNFISPGLGNLFETGSRKGPGALEGSAEAYKIISSQMINYAHETAINTRGILDVMRSNWDKVKKAKSPVHYPGVVLI